MTCFDSQICADCGMKTIDSNEYYMVTQSCWARAGMKGRSGMLCIGCLESRLGKQLTPQNFAECPLNWRNVLVPNYSSPRLLSRLLYGGNRSKWHRGALEILEEALRGNTKAFEYATLMYWSLPTVVDEVVNCR